MDEPVLGADDGSGVKAVNADVTGPGEYTVSLDFTGTKDGEAKGIAFTALGIDQGELYYPFHTIDFCRSASTEKKSNSLKVIQALMTVL